MSKVYRALERAEREKGISREEPFWRVFAEETVGPEEAPMPKDLERLEPLRKANVQASLAAPDSFAMEQFRKLRAHIARSSSHPRSLLITSAGPQEGKTTVALNLAWAFSQEMHKKVILVDADLRKPGLSLGDGTPKGLSDYLMNEISIAEVLLNFETANFMLLPAGAPSLEASEMVGSKKMKTLLTDLRQYGEDTYILIDSPPVLAASDPLLLSEWVDGVILVVKAKGTPRGTVRRVVDTIGREKIIGVVFNQKDLKTTENYSDYYYGYYHK